MENTKENEENIKCESIEQIVPWKYALNAARRTVGKAPLDKEPSDKWKAKMLLAEHSPIRLVQYRWTWTDIPQWVTVHYVRHHIGWEKFVSTQRTDRTGSEIPRDEHLQGERNNMDMVANAQEIINISKVRLCSKASAETRYAWKQMLNKLNDIDPILVSKCVPTCVYRGFCPELKTCGYVNTENFKKAREEYINKYVND